MGMKRGDVRLPKCGFRAALLFGCAFAISLFVAGCFGDTERWVEICSGVVDGIHLGAASITTLSENLEGRDGAVRISYQVREADDMRRVGWVRCIFEDAGYGGDPVLVRVVTPTGDLGEGRLYVLKRWWLNDEDATWRRDEG